MFDSIEQAERSMGPLDLRQHAPPFRHAFTHFRLLAEPILSAYDEANTGIKDGFDEGWVNADQAGELGMPKPIRILVSNFFAGKITWQEPSIA